jgi:UDP-3-O-[3-hydroxymyristoyl] N-acetylglucosamine deacetylase
VGLHSGRPAHITLLPAAPNTGIVFRIRAGGRQTEIPARMEHIVRTTLNTTLGRDDLQISTVEHLLAALAGLELDNVVIVTEGHEVPAVDGSAQPFVARIMESGRRLQPVARRYIKILAPVEVEDGSRLAGFYPAGERLFKFIIDFSNRAIGTQSFQVRLTPQSFVSELARARTFGFIDELEALQEQGLALGADLENAVGLSADGQVLNGEGLRFPDEFVRHKILDAVGDLSLMGDPILGEFRGFKSGHTLHGKLLQALVDQPQAWEYFTLTPQQDAQAV